MNLFRSEDHLRRWLGERPPGATISVSQLSALAHAWWSDRLPPEWRPHTREQNQAVLDRLGLTGDFWQLA
ncbi:MAG: hypothetical protein NVSMB29_16020 [Candidatus Dormibacteria bacterium]